MSAPWEVLAKLYGLELAKLGWKPTTSESVPNKTTNQIKLSWVYSDMLPKITPPTGQVFAYEVGDFWIIQVDLKRTPQTPEDTLWYKTWKPQQEVRVQYEPPIKKQGETVTVPAVAYTPDTAPRTVNWWLLGGVAVIAMGAILFLKRK